MSLQKETLMHIEGMSKAGKAVEGVDYNAVYIPEGMKIQDLEHLQQYKNRFTGDFGTNNLSYFSKYVNSQPEKSVFIHSELPIAIAIFDLGTKEQPLHAKHKAIFEVRKTAAYTELLKFVNARHNQEELAEFIEDWAEVITALDKDDKEMSGYAASKAVRKVTIETAAKFEQEVNQLSTSKSAFENIEANSGSLQLPTWLYFCCKPYNCLDDVIFPIRINMGLKRDEISFMLKVQKIEQIQEEIAESFAEKVSDAIDAKENLFIGQFSVNGSIDGRGRY